MDRYEMMDMMIEIRKQTALQNGYHWDDDENMPYDDNGEIVELWQRACALFFINMNYLNILTIPKGRSQSQLT